MVQIEKVFRQQFQIAKSSIGLKTLWEKRKMGNFFFSPKWEILDSSKLAEFADENSSLMKMAEFSIQIENTVGKGEIAHYKEFLIFPQCFQNTCIADM